MEIAAGLAAVAMGFYGRGWLLGTSGNLSAVVQREPLRMAMSPSGVDKGELKPEQLLSIDENARIGNAFLGDRPVGDRAAERHSRRDTTAHRFERALCLSDEAHAVMDPPRPEAALRNFEAAAFAEQDIVDRHAHVIEVELGMTFRELIFDLAGGIRNNGRVKFFIPGGASSQWLTGSDEHLDAPLDMDYVQQTFGVMLGSGGSAFADWRSAKDDSDSAAKPPLVEG